MEPTHITIDFETRSEINLLKCGAWAYFEHPSTEISCVAFKINDLPTKLWIAPYFRQFKGDIIHSELPLELFESAIIEAHNAEFERAGWKNIGELIYGWPEIPIERWRCSAAKAAALALPRSLEGAGSALFLPILKDKEVHRIMLKLCKPRKITKNNKNKWFEDPEDYQKLFRYCKTDVDAEHCLSHALPPLRMTEQKLWFIDQEINQRGIHIDIETIQTIMGLTGEHEIIKTDELFQLTNIEGITAKKLGKLKDWINDQCVAIPDLKAPTVTKALKNAHKLPDNVVDVLKIRKSLSQSSVSKYKRFMEMACCDSRIKGLFMFHGASTGRWAGKGIQPQNLPRGIYPDWESCIDTVQMKDLSFINDMYDDPMGVFSSCIRGMIDAKPGHELICADYSSIEAIILAWVAGEKSILDAFRAGRDLYKEAAVAIYKKPYEDITKEERGVGKIAVLALGYQGGFRAFTGMAASYGLNFNEDFAKSVVSKWREIRKHIVTLWASMEYCAIQAALGKNTSYKGINWGMRDDFLCCRLPSGRIISYYKPQVVTEKTKFGKYVKKLSFLGVDGYSRKWKRIETYGGKLTENIIQAIARDVLAHGIIKVNTKYPVVMHVHDEIISEVPEGFGSLEEYIKLMVDLPPWADGIPLKAEGWRGKRFRK